MSKWLWLAAAVLLAVAAGATWFAFHDPRFVAGLAAVAAAAFWKAILPALKGRPMTQAELAKWRAGENPHDTRQPGKDGGR